MADDRLAAHSARFLSAWNSHDVERVVACYTDDLEYRDPNTRGAVQGAAALRRYLTKLFAGWRMTWSLREAHPLEGGGGAAVLWRATFRAVDGDREATVEGMDLVIFAGERVRRNEVYFDRAALASLVG